MKWHDLSKQPCSIARSLAVVGDRWTLLILREAFLKTRRFEDFQLRLGITRHLLADRLARLVEIGVFSKLQYLDRPVRHEYRLTQMGRDLYPVLLALVGWGDKWLDGGVGAPVEFHHVSCKHKFAPTMVCSECGEPVNPRDVTPMTGPGMNIPLRQVEFRDSEATQD